MNKELLPCPFCGGEAKITERATAPDEPGFFCAISCFCGGYSARAHQAASGATSEIARSVAIAAWNTRVADQRCAELEAENARLREALKEIRDLSGEINPSNYDHDDACELNRQFCYALTIASAALGENRDD